MRRLLVFASCAAVLAMMGTPLAQNRAQTSAAVRQLGDYIRSPDHLKVVGAAIATFEPTILAAKCKDVKPVKGRAWQPVEEPIFDAGAKIPKAAAWQETWDIAACGKPGIRSIGFVIRTDQDIVPIPMFPGESLADLNLQLEAGQVALDTVAPGTLPCAEKNRIQVIESAVLNRADVARGRWSERWTVAGCNRTAFIDVTFSPGPRGRPNYEFQGRAGR
jgi:hypothetical protein